MKVKSTGLVLCAAVGVGVVFAVKNSNTALLVVVWIAAAWGLVSVVRDFRGSSDDPWTRRSFPRSGRRNAWPLGEDSYWGLRRSSLPFAMSGVALAVGLTWPSTILVSGTLFFIGGVWWLSISLLNRPSWSVPPAFRDQPGRLERWRARRRGGPIPPYS